MAAPSSAAGSATSRTDSASVETAAVGGDGSPIVGELNAESFIRFVRRLVATVENWPEVLARLVAASLHLKAGDIRTKLRAGPVIVAPPSRPAWWPTFEMFAEDVYHLVDLADIELRPGDVILDLGAHIGTAAVLFAQRWPDATLVCVEPNPQTYRYLEANLERNQINAQPHNVAIGANDGSAILFGADGASCEASTSVGVPGSQVQVPVASFERMMRQAPGPVRIVKLDCEGAEHAVLSVSTAELWRDVEVVLLEYHRTDDPLSTWPETERRVSALGFETCWQMPFPWYPGLGMAAFRRRRS